MNLFFWRKKKEVAPSPMGSMTLKQQAPLRFALTISGIVSPKIVTAAQTKILEVCKLGTKSRAIIHAEGFQGFSRGFDSGTSDVERMFSVDEIMDRIAVVAEPEMHEKLNIFMVGWSRKLQLKFFAPQDLDKASAWLEEP